MMTKRKIRACTKENRINLCLSNFMYTGKGYEADIQEMRNTINRQPMDPEKICRALNQHPRCTERFKPYKIIDSGFILESTDPWNNKHLLYIIEPE